jgi:hypothetical protein
MDQIPLFKPEKEKRKYQPKEWKVVALRECPTPDHLQLCDTPDKAVEYWRMHIATSPQFNPECECFVVILVNTRRKVKGHQLVSIGTLDSLLVSARETFRCAVVASAAAIVLMHNLCAQAHKLCYVTSRVMCSALSAALARTRRPHRKECCGCA